VDSQGWVLLPLHLPVGGACVFLDGARPPPVTVWKRRPLFGTVWTSELPFSDKVTPSCSLSLSTVALSLGGDPTDLHLLRTSFSLEGWIVNTYSTSFLFSVAASQHGFVLKIMDKSPK
jgi:hypothetical protein